MRGRFLVGALLELPREFNFVARNEFFFNFNTTDVVRRKGLGEDRLFAGVNRPFGRHLRLELGYQMQYLNPLPRIDIYKHTLLFGVTVRTPQAFDLL